MSFRVLVVALLLLSGAALLRADVAPFPTWRLVANGPVTSAVQAGDAVYVGGGFTKIGRGVEPFDALLDPLTMTVTRPTGCARQAGRTLTPWTAGGHVVYTPMQWSYLEDAAGLFYVDDDTVLVKLGPDCRFDRRFRTVVPGRPLVWGVVEAGGRVYASVGLPMIGASNYVVELDATSGVIRRYWPGGPVVGLTVEGRLLWTVSTGLNTTLGWFDPDQGQFATVRTMPGAWNVVHTGGVVVIAGNPSLYDLMPRYQFQLLDSQTLTALPQWPEVLGSQASSAVAVGGGRLIIATLDQRIDGVPAPRFTTFDLNTGARVTGFSAPAWLEDPSSDIRSMYVAGGRLLVFGDFGPGAPRDTLAVLDLGTGSLDPADLPYVAPTAVPLGARLHLGTITSAARIARDRVAAVHPDTGEMLPWTALGLPPDPVGPWGRGVRALAADGAYLYAGGIGIVRRVGLDTGVVDPSWRLDVEASPDTPGAVSAVALHAGRVYVAGNVARVRDADGAPWQARTGGAAITIGGQLTPWNPRVEAACTGVFGTDACISQLAASQGRFFLRGDLQRLDAPGEPRRSFMAVDAANGALDPVLPLVPKDMVLAIGAGPDAVFAMATVNGQRLLARVEAFGTVSVLASLGSGPFIGPPLLGIAERAGRIYADQERDEASGLPAGNRWQWSRPFAASTGVLDVQWFGGTLPGSVSWHPQMATTVPGPPTDFRAELDETRLTLRWTPAASDLRPLVVPAVPGGVAATSYVITARLAPGGPVVAQIDTRFADTHYALYAPGGTFFVQVQGRNAAGTGAPSDELRVDVPTQISVPAPPIATVATVIGRDVLVQWQPAPRGSYTERYVLEAGTQPGAADIGVVPVSGPEFRASDVPPGRYYVRVRGVNSMGLGAPGDEIAVDVR